MFAVCTAILQRCCTKIARVKLLLSTLIPLNTSHQAIQLAASFLGESQYLKEKRTLQQFFDHVYKVSAGGLPGYITILEAIRCAVSGS